MHVVSIVQYSTVIYHLVSTSVQMWLMTCSSTRPCPSPLPLFFLPGSHPSRGADSIRNKCKEKKKRRKKEGSTWWCTYSTWCCIYLCFWYMYRVSIPYRAGQECTGTVRMRCAGATNSGSLPLLGQQPRLLPCPRRLRRAPVAVEATIARRVRVPLLVFGSTPRGAL